MINRSRLSESMILDTEISSIILSVSMKFMVNTKIIKYLSSNTSCFIVFEATCFGPYMTIIRSICESS